MDLRESLGKVLVALKAPLGDADREQGWTDELRREIQEEISVSRSTLTRPGPWAVITAIPASMSGWHAKACSRDASVMRSWTCKHSSWGRGMRHAHGDNLENRRGSDVTMSSNPTPTAR
jgi:hypothetical protein